MNRNPKSELGWGLDEWFQVTRQRLGVRQPSAALRTGEPKRQRAAALQDAGAPFDTPLLVWLGMVGGAGENIRPAVRHPEDEKQPSWFSGFGFRVSFGLRTSDFGFPYYA